MPILEDGMNPEELLQQASTVLLVDWPSKDVPESLVRAGFNVIVKGGPGPQDYSVYVLENDRVISRHVGHAPAESDIVCCYRPLNELPSIIVSRKTAER
ncbi:MAG: hypothetical protein ACXVZV_07455 [Terriglobales bacterium]